jgi:hypothetical protein
MSLLFSRLLLSRLRKTLFSSLRQKTSVLMIMTVVLEKGVIIRCASPVLRASRAIARRFAWL